MCQSDSGMGLGDHYRVSQLHSVRIALPELDQRNNPLSEEALNSKRRQPPSGNVVMCQAVE